MNFQNYKHKRDLVSQDNKYLRCSQDDKGFEQVKFAMGIEIVKTYFFN